MRSKNGRYSIDCCILIAELITCALHWWVMVMKRPPATHVSFCSSLYAVRVGNTKHTQQEPFVRIVVDVLADAINPARIIISFEPAENSCRKTVL